MTISISKALGKTRLTLSQQGLYGSVGLGGGVRVGTDLVEFKAPKKSRKKPVEEVIEQPGKPLMGKWAALMIAVMILCVIPVTIGYMFLWTWIANIIAIVCIPAALISAIYVMKDKQ